MDSSLDGDGAGSESRSPSERLVSLNGDARWVIVSFWLLLFADGSVFPRSWRCSGANEGADLEATGRDIEGCKEEEDVVEDEEADDRVITPATGIRTIHRWRLSKL